MTECKVTCFDCRSTRGSGPKVWEWLCECCAEECQDAHRRETGHDVHLSVVTEPTMLPRQIVRAARSLIPPRI